MKRRFNMIIDDRCSVIFLADDKTKLSALPQNANWRNIAGFAMLAE